MRVPKNNVANVVLGYFTGENIAVGKNGGTDENAHGHGIYFDNNDDYKRPADYFHWLSRSRQEMMVDSSVVKDDSLRNDGSNHEEKKKKEEREEEEEEVMKEGSVKPDDVAALRVPAWTDRILYR